MTETVKEQHKSEIEKPRNVTEGRCEKITQELQNKFQRKRKNSETKTRWEQKWIDTTGSTILRDK